MSDIFFFLGKLYFQCNCKIGDYVSALCLLSGKLVQDTFVLLGEKVLQYTKCVEGHNVAVL